MIETFKNGLKKEQQGLDLSQSPQQCHTKLVVKSNYADIFNRAYPLILHDSKAALQTLAIKVPSSFWYYFWLWSSNCVDKILEQYEFIVCQCNKILPELCSDPLQRKACYEALERVKPKLINHEM